MHLPAHTHRKTQRKGDTVEVKTLGLIFVLIAVHEDQFELEY